MSDIQEEQKRLYKKAEENDLKATMKPLFPEDVEMIYISKDDYDRLYGDLTYENVELQQEINRLNNIISEALGIANERINYYYHNKNDELLKEWEEIFEKLVKRDTELKGDNK